MLTLADLPPTPTIAYLAAAMALVGLMAYAVFAGADFGGGVWDLFASGPRKRRQQEAIAEAMGPVWEANHVWLIFVIVVLFTCFPRGYAVLVEALFLPLHVILAGIMFRGAAFVFRHYGPATKGSPPTLSRRNIWGIVFGAASIVSPAAMGWAFGVATSGKIRVLSDRSVAAHVNPFAPFPIFCGLLALSTCAYLGAVYLVVATRGDLRADFRKRAILAGSATAFLAVATLISASADAPWLFDQLRSARAIGVVTLGALAFAVSAYAAYSHRPRLARASAVAQTVLMLLGWGLAHRDYLMYPDVPLSWAKAPEGTLLFMLVGSSLGMTILVPSLLLLFKVFSSSEVAAAE